MINPLEIRLVAFVYSFWLRDTSNKRRIRAKGASSRTILRIECLVLALLLFLPGLFVCGRDKRTAGCASDQSSNSTIDESLFYSFLTLRKARVFGVREVGTAYAPYYPAPLISTTRGLEHVEYLPIAKLPFGVAR